MKNICDFKNKVKFLFTDIDDTLTDEGQIHADAFAALWNLHQHGVHVIPVTGRPAGWCEMIARTWPVSGVVGENGGFYFRYHNKKMHRDFYFNPKTQEINRAKLDDIQKEVLQSVPGCAVASDQFCRMMDLAIDFCEDVPALPEFSIRKIVSIFEKHGAQAKVSSIHVNGWFGDYNKLSQTLHFLQKEFNVSPPEAKLICAFAGDSPNDEPMWEYFPQGLAVANINNFMKSIKYKPAFVANHVGGKGFAEIAAQILLNNKTLPTL